MDLHIEIEREDDGRWIAEIPDLPGVMVYGDNPASAIEKVKTLAVRVLEERVAAGEAEVVEDIALVRAIQEGEATDPVSRAEVFQALENDVRA